VSLGYLAGGSDHPFTQLWLMRLVSALLAGIAAACAYATVRELLPRRREFAVAAGLIVAFQPMVAFMFGVVNNDAGVNAFAALFIYLLVRGLRRGPTVGWGMALAATAVALPAMKATGVALYPAAGVALAGMLWRYHSRASVPGYAALAVTSAGAYVLRRALVALADPPVVASGGGAASASGPINYVLDRPELFLSYAWQAFLPRLWFMRDLWVQKWPAFDIYIEGGWGAFGWLVFRFPTWVYLVVVSVSLLMALGCAVALLRHRLAALARGWEIAVLTAAVAGVVFGVEAAYLTDSPRPVPAEQGRYAFTAIVPLATVAVGGALAVGERLRPLVLAVLVAATMGLGYAGQLVTLSGFFT
jgi:4-amino-4-deoxy-L-arabinose transferase-like glycosyltransferase